MAEEQKTGEETPKNQWVKPQVSLVEAGKAESAPPGPGPEVYYAFS